MSRLSASEHASIAEIAAEVPGWTAVEQLETLHNLVCDVSQLEGDIVEIGSWCGRSASVLGLAAQAIGNTRVHCIDLFPERSDWHQNQNGTYSFAVMIEGVVSLGCEHQTVWPEVWGQQIDPVYERFGTIRDAFDSQIAKAGLEQVVQAHRGTSASFVRSVPAGFSCRLAFVDGEHSYEAVSQDIHNLEMVLAPDAWLCFDDAFSGYAGVDRAIEELVAHDPRYRRQQHTNRKLFIAQWIGPTRDTDVGA